LQQLPFYATVAGSILDLFSFNPLRRLTASSSSSSSLSIIDQKQTNKQTHNMPPLLTQVARVSDGLPLVAIQTPAPGIPVASRDQQEAKELLRKITAG
jgi:hypothetical protein